MAVKPVVTKKDDDHDDKGDDDKEEKVSNLGLRELIDLGETGSRRILHRNINSGSPRFYI
ncbi:unnamed protein product [Ilex paraguariensis]|uniref:Uncharacterized protein n=1 Tax=Ilex paraguariensis TaxID=185542 RepID=A0ABC8RQI0_9AQUA